MAKFTDYTQKTKPADADLLLIHDNAGAANKKTPFSGVWSWILDKLASAVISQLETTNKSIIPAINELNSKSNYLRDIPTINPELLSPGQTLLDYVVNNYSSKSSVYFFGIPSTLTSEQKNPFPGTGGFAILYNSSTTGYSSIYAFSYLLKIKGIRTQDGIWEPDWVEL